MPRDLAALHDALRSYLPWGERITGIRPMTHGLSNGTYLLEGADRVLRMPPDEAGLLPPYDMDRQHGIYRRVGATPGAPPVPQVFELCEDESVAGAPFYVMERLPGESFDRHTLPAWLTGDPATADAFCQAWIEVMAAVHRMPPGVLEGPPKTVGEEAREWLEEAHESRSPQLVVDVLEEYAAKPPAPTGPPTAVHGDPNLTNILWDGPRVVALLDWELSRNGEPFADIAFLLAFCRDEGEPEPWGIGFPGWWSKPQMVRHWERVTGRRVESWRQHELLAMARLATIMAVGTGLVAAGRKSDPRVEELAEKLPRYVERMERRRTRVGVED